MPLPPARPRLHDAFATPTDKRRYVGRLFATIADRYDLITRLLSFGRDQRWKARLIDLARIEPGARVLDVACGTGDLASRAAAAGARVAGLDLTLRMIVLARRKPGAGRIAWLVGDISQLPVAAGTKLLERSGSKPAPQPAGDANWLPNGQGYLREPRRGGFLPPRGPALASVICHW